MAHTELEIDLFAPYPRSATLRLARSTPWARVPALLAPLCPLDEQSLSLFSGKPLPADGSLDAPYVHVRLAVRLRGGKGGFGSQLRAAGGRMAGQKTSNKDSCRTLDGRRLSTVKEAQVLADYIRTAPEREAKKREEAREKLKALQAEISRLESQSGGGALKRRAEDDDADAERHEERSEEVKDAVKAALLKRKKKKLAAADAAPATDAPVASGSGTKPDDSSTVVAAAA